MAAQALCSLYMYTPQPWLKDDHIPRPASLTSIVKSSMSQGESNTLSHFLGFEEEQTLKPVGLGCGHHLRPRATKFSFYMC